MDAEELYLIQSGLIEIGKLTSDGKDLTLRICQKHDIIGELTLFTDEPRYMLSAKVLEDGRCSSLIKQAGKGIDPKRCFDV